MAKEMKLGFDRREVILLLAKILPSRQLKPVVRLSQKYQQVLSSVRELGIIEPLVVFPQNGKQGNYLLLDGHVRLEALKQLGMVEARCLIATDDEAFTYNKRINRIATIQEHNMILAAIKSGVSEERIARVLNVNVKSIREKRDLLDGICKEAVEILKNRHLAPGVFGVLKKMKPMRQIEAAELIAAANNLSVPFCKALLAATKPEMLVNPGNKKPVEGLAPEQVAKIEKEMDQMQRNLKLIEQTHGDQVLNLVLARGYLGKLFANSRVVKYLGQNHGDIYRELKSIVEAGALEE